MLVVICCLTNWFFFVSPALIWLWAGSGGSGDAADPPGSDRFACIACSTPRSPTLLRNLRNHISFAGIQSICVGQRRLFHMMHQCSDVFWQDSEVLSSNTRQPCAHLFGLRLISAFEIKIFSKIKEILISFFVLLGCARSEALSGCSVACSCRVLARWVSRVTDRNWNFFWRLSSEQPRDLFGVLWAFIVLT